MTEAGKDSRPAWWRGLLRLAVGVEGGFDLAKRRVAGRFGRNDSIQILAYRGYGTPERLLLEGRVLRDPPLAAAGERDDVWRNLVNTWLRFESDEVPGARVRARLDGWEEEATADDEGYFRFEIRPQLPLGPGPLWRKADLELVEPRSPAPPEPVTAAGDLLVPPENARFGVISDIDDTVVETGVADRLAMARTVFLGNARTRLPFKGIAAFYAALHEGKAEGEANEEETAGPNPIFYVSSSPWNLYGLLVEFMELQSIPRGPLLLRDYGIDRSKLFKSTNREHKLARIRPILETYPRLPFLLVGDSGEQDPEIYREVVREYPGRILAIYIRSVHSGGAGPLREAQVLELARQVREEGVAMLLVKDTEAAAVHAAENGWIRPERLADVREEKVKDEVAPSPVEAAVAGSGPSGPTPAPSASQARGSDRR